MKKLFAILAIAGFMTACNNGSDSDKATTNDTSKMAPVTDATKTMDSASKMMDTAAKKMDTAAKKMDKAMDKMKDAKDKMQKN